jgi:hypothetical protein
MAELKDKIKRLHPHVPASSMRAGDRIIGLARVQKGLCISECGTDVKIVSCRSPEHLEVISRGIDEGKLCTENNNLIMHVRYPIINDVVQAHRPEVIQVYHPGKKEYLLEKNLF